MKIDIMRLYRQAMGAQLNQNRHSYKDAVRRFTRHLFKHERNECEVCERPMHKNDLEFHHVQYKFPPLREDVKVVCHACNVKLGEAPIQWNPKLEKQTKLIEQ